MLLYIQLVYLAKDIYELVILVANPTFFFRQLNWQLKILFFKPFKNLILFGQSDLGDLWTKLNKMTDEKKYWSKTDDVRA